jgi:hypothetical protein
MYKKNGPNSLTQYYQLYQGPSGSETEIGFLIADYMVISYDDVQVQDFLSVNQPENRKFMLHCSQRIVIYNPSGIDVNPDTDKDAYNNYPALINTSLALNTVNGQAFQLLDYSPQTVNTQVQNSGTTGDSTGQTQTSSTSNTVGSSTSQSNSYGVTVSVGLTEMNDSASANYEHSSTTSQDKSSTTGTDNSIDKSTDASNTASMSVKDWGAYALANPTNQSPTWLFGQEYPWSAIQCRKTDGTLNPINSEQVKLILPGDMVLRLYNQIGSQVALCPPSQLSEFGINFVSKALWLVTLDDTSADSIGVAHTVNYFSASHAISGTTVAVYMDQKPSILHDANDNPFVTTMDLPLMALDVLGAKGKPAIVGFIPNKFTVQPAPVNSQGDATLFKIISTANTLLIQDTTEYPANCTAGAGFYPSQTCLTGNFTADCLALRMTLYFKVVDTVNDYQLILKHWKTGNTDMKLTFTINGDASTSMVKYVDALEAEGGENNLLMIALRDQSYASVDYHDYLQLGLNSIEIQIEPVTGTFVQGDGYTIRAVSIENS